MGPQGLTQNQQLFLEYFKTQPTFTSNFYFTGGTCLSAYYLHHRFSEDLDFFSEAEFQPTDVTVALKQAQESLRFVEIDFQQSFNRNIYQLIFAKKEILKVEFTYFPFTPVEQHSQKDSMKIDSLVDIAVNKVFTIYQNPRGRDYYDLYCIIEKKGWTIGELLRKARIKFDFHIDYLQFGTQLMEVKKMKDDPILVKDIKRQEVEDFFFNQAKLLKDKILQ